MKCLNCHSELAPEDRFCGECGTAAPPTKPVETKPVEAKPVEIKATETKVPEIRPAQSLAAQTRPAEIRPAETTNPFGPSVKTNPFGPAIQPHVPPTSSSGPWLWITLGCLFLCIVLVGGGAVLGVGFWFLSAQYKPATVVPQIEAELSHVTETTTIPPPPTLGPYTSNDADVPDTAAIAPLPLTPPDFAGEAQPSESQDFVIRPEIPALGPPPVSELPPGLSPLSTPPFDDVPSP